MGVATIDNLVTTKPTQVIDNELKLNEVNDPVKVTLKRVDQSLTIKEYNSKFMEVFGIPASVSTSAILYDNYMGNATDKSVIFDAKCQDSPQYNFLVLYTLFGEPLCCYVESSYRDGEITLFIYNAATKLEKK